MSKESLVMLFFYGFLHTDHWLSNMEDNLLAPSEWLVIFGLIVPSVIVSVVIVKALKQKKFLRALLTFAACALTIGIVGLVAILIIVIVARIIVALGSESAPEKPSEIDWNGMDQDRVRYAQRKAEDLCDVLMSDRRVTNDEYYIMQGELRALDSYIQNFEENPKLYPPGKAISQAERFYMRWHSKMSNPSRDSEYWKYN